MVKQVVIDNNDDDDDDDYDDWDDKAALMVKRVAIMNMRMVGMTGQAGRN